MNTPVSSLEKLVPDYIKRFEAYTPSPPDDVLKRRYRVKALHRLNNNENPLGPSPAALSALAEYPPENASIYPSGDCYHLRHALAEKFALSPEQFLVGNGANEVIAFVIKAFCEAGDNIITADRTFAVYEWVAEFSGFEARLVPLRDYSFDAEEMVARIDGRTKILFVCNPNNPTGTIWNKETFHRFMSMVGPDKIVVLDEAYREYVEDEEYPDGMEMIARYPNLVVFRTFSKMYGLAGLRVGYLAASRDLVELIRRTCIVYSVNAPGQVAALAALSDDEHVSNTRRVVREGKDILISHLKSCGLWYLDGAANYLTVRVPMSDTILYKRLMKRGYMIRPMTGFRFPNHIRVSAGPVEVMDGLGQELARLMKEYGYER